MKIVWERDQTTVRDVYEAILERRKVAYTTVMTMMNILEQKKYLKKRLADPHTRVDVLQTAWYESKRAGLETELVLGLIQVESGFRKYAISSSGARGYMQVMPFWARLIGDGDDRRLFHLQTNLRFGCTILRHYFDVERGDAFMALGRYNGSRGRPEYPNAVQAARRAWEFKPA